MPIMSKQSGTADIYDIHSHRY